MGSTGIRNDNSATLLWTLLHLPIQEAPCLCRQWYPRAASTNKGLEVHRDELHEAMLRDFKASKHSRLIVVKPQDLS